MKAASAKAGLAILGALRNFVMVSGVCWGLHNLVVIVLARAGAPLALCVAASFVVTVPVGYALHSLVSFKTAFAPAAFARYALAMSVNLPLAFVALWLWRDLVGLRIELAAPIASASSTLVNFALCRLLVFGRGNASVATGARP